MYSEQIEQLIKSVIADGVITEKERAVLHKRAAAEGIDEDEIDVYVDGLLTQKKAETPQNASIDFNYVNKSKHDWGVIYQGQKPYLLKSHGGPIQKLYMNFCKIIKDKDNKTIFGIIVIPIIKATSDLYRRLQIKTETTSLELPREYSGEKVFVPEILKQKYKDLNWDPVTLHLIDEEMLKILCDSNNITVSILNIETRNYYDKPCKKYDIKDIPVDDLATYAQVFYRSVIDNSAYPDAVIIENESSKAAKSNKENYDVSDVDDDMVIRLLTEDTNKWEKIKPRPGIIDQYKGLKGITITDIHFSADCGGRDEHLELKALSDKKSNHRFFFVYIGGWSGIRKDLKLTVNLEDHELRYLQHNDKYVYEVEASVLKEIFTTRHDISLDDSELESVPQSSWKKGFDYLTDSNKMKEWLDKYEENKESGIFGKIKNLFG